MMKSEFIERTGFEPTEEEYGEIEAEYMGCDCDKNSFCAKWKKNNGIQRLMRIRARRIEELEHLLKVKENQYEEMDNRHAREFLKSRDKWKFRQEELQKKIENLNDSNTALAKLLQEEKKEKMQAETNMRKVQEAFTILGLKEVK